MIREPDVRALVAAFGVHVREHYHAAGAPGAVGRDRVLEVLNALAVTAATVLAGTGADEAAMVFFLDALNQQLEGFQAERAEAETPPLN